VADALVLGRYLVLAGAARFLIEFIRVNDRVLFGLTVAHLLSLGVMLAGTIVIVRHRGAERVRS
jgi:phosphatidylglycerol:prolipoprotein diacylglycerol transferase